MSFTPGAVRNAEEEEEEEEEGWPTPITPGRPVVGWVQ
jgi:hypothetical protein